MAFSPSHRTKRPGAAPMLLVAFLCLICFGTVMHFTWKTPKVSTTAGTLGRARAPPPLPTQHVEAPKPHGSSGVSLPDIVQQHERRRQQLEAHHDDAHAHLEEEAAMLEKEKEELHKREAELSKQQELAERFVSETEERLREKEALVKKAEERMREAMDMQKKFTAESKKQKAMMRRAAKEREEEVSNAVRAEEIKSHSALYAYQQDLKEWLYQHEDIRKQIDKKDFKSFNEIPRYRTEDLPFEKFFHEFEEQNRPVVITGINLQGDGSMWTRQTILEHCGDRNVTPAVPMKQKGKSWGNLEYLESMTVSDFLSKLARDNPNNESRPNAPYMHDWSLPSSCPELLQQYHVPKYFVQDYLAKGTVVDEGQAFQPFASSWPSLFIGDNGTGSGLHIDVADTHFVMYMIEGKKEFRVLRPHDRIVAYESRLRSTFQSDLFYPDFNKYPLLSLAEVWRAYLEPGDLLFIPGGSAHQVVNHSPIISMSTNFVDASNVHKVVVKFMETGEQELADSLERKSRGRKLKTRLDPEPKSVWWPDYNRSLFR